MWSGARPRRERELWLGKRSRRVLRVPTIIERAVRHRVPIRENLRGVIVDERNARLVQLIASFGQPTIANPQSGRRVMRAVDVSPAPQSSLLGFNRVGDHSANRCHLRRVEPANQKHGGPFRFTYGAVALKIGIRNWPGNLLGKCAKRRDFRIDRSVVPIPERRTAGFVSRIIRRRADLQRHSFYDSNEPNRVAHYGDRTSAGFVQRPPLPLLEGGAQWIANHRVVFVATDLLRFRNAEADEMITRDAAFLSVKFRQLDGFRNVLVEENDRRGRERLFGECQRRAGREQEKGKPATIHSTDAASIRHRRCRRPPAIRLRWIGANHGKYE